MAKQTRDWTEILTKRGLVGPDQIKEAQRMNSMPLEDALAKLGYAEPEDIMKAKAEQYGMDFVELREIEIPASVIELVPESLARENIVMPLAQDERHHQGHHARPDGLRDDREAPVRPESRDRGGPGPQGGDRRGDQPLLQQLGGDRVGRLDAPGVHRHGHRLHRGHRRRPGREHVEHARRRGRAGHQAGAPDHPGSGQPCGPPTSTSSRSPTGSGSATGSTACCMERDSPPRRLLASIVSRLKIMGSIDIAEKRRPQDGRIKILAAGKDVDLRVSILPTSHGQSVVMRILDRDNIKVGLRDLGFGEEDWKRFSAADQAAERDLPGDRADRLGQDDHALRRAQRAEPPRRQDHHGRGPGRVLPAGRQPVRGPGQDRHDLRPDHPRHAAAESEHPPGGRNPRRGDGRTPQSRRL